MGFRTLISGVKFFAMLTSLRWHRGFEICGGQKFRDLPNSAAEGDRDKIGVKMRRRVDFLYPFNKLYGCILITKRVKSKKYVFLQFGGLPTGKCYIYSNFFKCYKLQCSITSLVAILNERLNALRNKGGGEDGH